MFIHKDEPIYLANLEEVSIKLNSYSRFSQTLLQVQNILFYNISKIAGPHCDIIKKRTTKEKMDMAKSRSSDQGGRSYSSRPRQPTTNLLTGRPENGFVPSTGRRV